MLGSKRSPWDGNIHFLINEYFSDPASQDRYQRFTEELVALVLSLGMTEDDAFAIPGSSE